MNGEVHCGTNTLRKPAGKMEVVGIHTVASGPRGAVAVIAAVAALCCANCGHDGAAASLQESPAGAQKTRETLREIGVQDMNTTFDLAVEKTGSEYLALESDLRRTVRPGAAELESLGKIRPIRLRDYSLSCLRAGPDPKRMISQQPSSISTKFLSKAASLKPAARRRRRDSHARLCQPGHRTARAAAGQAARVAALEGHGRRPVSEGAQDALDDGGLVASQ